MPPRARAASSSRRRPSRPGSCPRRTPTTSLPTQLKNWLTRWPQRLAASAAVAVAIATCARPVPMARPRAGEPEIRVGLVTGQPRAVIGGTGQGELAAVVDGNPEFQLAPGEQAVVHVEGFAVVIEVGSMRWRHERVSFVNLDP